MSNITSINIQPAKINRSEAHNERKVKLDYILPGREGHHEHWKEEVILDRLKVIEEIYSKKVGQKMQERATPIREGVVVINPETSMQDLQALGKKLKECFGIACFQIHIHRDEGRIVTKKEEAVAKAKGDYTITAGKVIVNYHAHLIFDWQDKGTGRTFKLKPVDMRNMQSITAEVLGMQRGQSNSRAMRLEAKEFKDFREKLKEESSHEIEKIKDEKRKALIELQRVEEQKKNLLNSLSQLKERGRKMIQDSEESKKNYEQTLKRLQGSREELKRLEPKYQFLKQLEVLPWSTCSNGTNVGFWLRVKQGMSGVEIKSGQDGSIYFQKGDIVARLKDMEPTMKDLIKGKLKLDIAFQKQQAIKWRRHHQERRGHKLQ